MSDIISDIKTVIRLLEKSLSIAKQNKLKVQVENLNAPREQNIYIQKNTANAKAIEYLQTTNKEKRTLNLQFHTQLHYHLNKSPSI